MKRFEEKREHRKVWENKRSCMTTMCGINLEWSAVAQDDISKCFLTFVIQLQTGMSSNHSREQTGLGLVSLEIGNHFVWSSLTVESA